MCYYIFSDLLWRRGLFSFQFRFLWKFGLAYRELHAVCRVNAILFKTSISTKGNISLYFFLNLLYIYNVVHIIRSGYISYPRTYNVFKYTLNWFQLCSSEKAFAISFVFIVDLYICIFALGVSPAVAATEVTALLSPHNLCARNSTFHISRPFIAPHVLLCSRCVFVCFKHFFSSHI